MEVLNPFEFLHMDTPIGNPPVGKTYFYYKPDGFLYQKSSAGVESKVDTPGTEVIEIQPVDPTVNDDNTQGNFIGQRWYNTTTFTWFLATSVGTGTATWQAIKRKRKNYVLVQSLSDFPAPVGSVITLADNTYYEINGGIGLNTLRLQLGDQTTIAGKDRFRDQLFYSGNVALFNGVSVTAEIHTLLLNVPNGKIFDISSPFKDEQFKMHNCLISTCNEIGRVENILTVDIRNCYFGSININGITSVGASNGQFIWFDNQMLNINSGVLFNLGTSVWDYWEADRSELHIKVAGSPIGISGLPNNGNINIKGLITGNRWLEGGAYIDSTPASDIRIGGTKWDFLSNNGVPDISDNIATGYYSMENNATVTDIVTQNVWVKIAGTTVAGSNNLRFNTLVSNRLTYIGTNEYKGNVTITGNADVASGRNNYEFTVFKNGVKIPNVLSAANVVNGKPNGFAFSAPIDAVTNDYFEVYVRCTDSNKDVNVSNLHASIG